MLEFATSRLAESFRAIELSAQSAREAGADILVDAPALGLCPPSAKTRKAEAVANAICEGWYAYEREPWPRPQTDIEKQVLALAAGKQK